MKIIFITRKYPPSIGGMEKLSYEITTRISKKNKSSIIALKRSQWLLPFFLLYAITKVLMEKKEENCIVHIGDGVLSPIGPIIKRIIGCPIVLTLHGLDITFSNRLYQKVMPFFMKKYDKIICISNKVLEECKERGIEPEKCTVIPIGIKISEINKNKKDLEQRLRMKLEGKELLLSVGRLIERKGFHWFISKPLPLMLKKYPNIVYLLVGSGPLKSKINKIIKENNLENNVFLLGKVDNLVLADLFSCSNIFVMPNIKVKGDMEGFGIVALEAASYGLPVVTSNLEGIRDAIQDRKNGLLLEPQNEKEYQKTLLNLIKNKEKQKSIGKKARIYTEQNFSWNKRIDEYLKAFNSVC